MASGSNDFLLELAPSFEKSVLDLEEATYGRKDKKGPTEFRARLEQELEKLFDYPRIAGCRKEPFPPKVGDRFTDLGWTFHKVEFTVPRANASARQGRLMFLVHLGERVIIPICVYNHLQFPGRVPDRSLEEIIDSAVKKSQELKVIKVPTALAVTPVGEPVESESNANAPVAADASTTAPAEASTPVVAASPPDGAEK